MSAKKNYFELDGVNQSTLKTILMSPNDYVEAISKNRPSVDGEKAHFQIGSVLDEWITAGYPSIADIAKVISFIPKPKEQEVLLYVYDTFLKDYSAKDAIAYYTHNKDGLLTAGMEAIGYYSNRKKETNMTNLINNEQYLLEFIVSKDSYRLSQTQYEEIHTIIDGVSGGIPNVHQPFANMDNYSIINKVVIQAHINGIFCKGELDRVYVNHVLKQIIPMDYKSALNYLGFIWNYFKHRYDFQSAFYKLLLKAVATEDISRDSDSNNNAEIRELLNNGYTIGTFMFGIIPKQAPYFYMNVQSKNGEQIGTYGGEHKGKHYEGVFDALNRLQAAIAKDEWRYPLECLNNENYVYEIE